MQVHNIFAQIEVDGTSIGEYYSIQISQRFNQHHSFSITLPHEVLEAKGSFTLSNAKSLVGKGVLINLCSGTKDKVVNEFKGIICNVSIKQADTYHSQIILNGYSPTILLENWPHTTCFTQKNLQKIADEATKDVAAECSVNLNPVYTKTLKYFTQYKESNFEFLNRLSAEFGEWFFYDGKELFFGKPDTSKSVDLIAGKDITSLELKMQVMPLTCKSFSYQSKDDSILSGSTPSGLEAGGVYGKFAHGESNKLYTEVTTPAIRPRVETKADLDNFLKIQKSAQAAQLEVVSGTSTNAEIILGSVATILVSSRSGDGFTQTEQGNYVITGIDHKIAEGKYQNTFEGLPSAIEVMPVATVKKPMAEQQIAVVKDNSDPDNLGRVKVQMLWHSQNATTDWIRVMTSDGGLGGKTGKNRGFVFIPEVNDQVVVGFRYNDPDRPFVMGSLFHGKSATGGGTDNKIKTISTNKGNTITMDDDKGSMLMEDVKGNSVLIDGTGNININCTELIELKTGDSSITLKKDGTILITGKMKVEVKSDQTVNIEGTSKVAVKSDQAVSIEGTTEVGVKGTNIAVKANANLDLAANANLSAKATANLALEGTAMAKLSSAAMTEITAALVKIN